jgi:hypothetical protein
MYRLEGSWDPIDPLIGGPPGIPGSPRPAEPNLFPALELVVGLIPGLSPDVGSPLAWPESPALGVACGDCTA